MRKARVGKLVMWVLVGVVALGAMGGVSYLVATRLVASPPRQVASTAGEAVLYHAGKYLTNLRDNGGRRYISVDITLELSTGRMSKELESKKVLLEHTIISVLRDKTYGELEGEDGMLGLARDLADRINGILESGKVQRIFFTEFLIQ
ncbi:MAG: flagellar basal body-associated FliL family protein [Bacillota bacterium]|nr:flagellar basal body-associated FliL family protein [Bacillota bacterium]